MSTTEGGSPEEPSEDEAEYVIEDVETAENPEGGAAMCYIPPGER